jgi:hypothetical protein
MPFDALPYCRIEVRDRISAMKAVFVLAAAGLAFGQIRVLSPTAKFDLNPNFKSHRFGRYARSFFAAAPTRLTLVTIGDNNVSLTSADRDGHVVYSTSSLVTVHARIYAALPRPDGCVWLVSGGLTDCRTISRS